MSDNIQNDKLNNSEDKEQSSNKIDISEIEKQFDTEKSTIFSERATDTYSKKKIKKDKTEGGMAKKSNTFLRTIALLLALAVIMTGTMFALKYLWPVDESKNNTEETTKSGTIDLTASANVALKDMKNADKNAISNISKISITNKSGSLEVVPDKLVKAAEDTTSADGEELSETVQYKVVGYDNIPQDTDKLSSLANGVFSIVAISQLQGEWTKEDCGLDKPVVKLNVDMADGSSFDFSVGKEVPDGNNDYYAETSLKDGIYLVNVDYYDNYNTTINDYTDTALVTALSSSGTNDTYFTDSKLTKYDSIAISGSHVANPINLIYAESSTESLIYRITAPVSTYANDEKISSLLAPLSGGMTASSTLKVNPTADDYKKYGITDPYFEIKYVVKGVTYDLKFSKPNIKTEGYYCCTVNDVPVIYEIMQDMYEFIEWDLGDIRSSILYVRNIETIDKMTVEFENKSTVYDISYDKVQTTTSATTAAVSDTTAAAADNDSYKVNVISNAAMIDAPSFQNIYSHIILVSPYAYLKAGEKSPTGDSVLTISNKNTDGSTEVLKFIKYDDRYYNYTINGVGDGLVRYDTVDKLINEFKTLQSGKTVES